MTTFHLTVVTPDGCAFDGQAERVVCRAIDGDLAILAKHGDYCTALGMGEAHIVDAEGTRRRAASNPVAAWLYRLVPNWQNFWMADALTGGGTIPWAYVGQAALYAGWYLAGVLALGMLAFSRAEVKG